MPEARLTLTAPAPRRLTRIQPLTFCAWLATTAIAAFLTADPAGHGTHQRLGLAPCPSALLLGRPCPGCGLTTSWTATVHGDFPSAFQAHALGPILYTLFTIWAIGGMFAFARGHRLRTDTQTANTALIALAVIFFGYGAWRFATVSDYRTARERAFMDGTAVAQPVREKPVAPTISDPTSR